jgi:opacity protein-like surface antigen
MRLLALLAVLLTAPAAAQPDVGFVLRAGGTWSELSVDLTDEGADATLDTDRAAGFELAAQVAFDFAYGLGLAGEVAYAHRAYSRTISALAPTDGGAGFTEQELPLETSFDQVSLAVLGRVDLLRRGAVVPYLTAGPRLDALIGSNAGSGYLGSPIATVYVEDPLSYQFGDANFSGVAGLGVEVRRVLGSALRVEARYSRSLTNFFSGDRNRSTDADALVSGIDVSVGVVW